MRSPSASSTSPPSATAAAEVHAPHEHQGIFQSQHVKAFPVRAAIDIGTGGVLSLCIGRVDANVGAIQRLLHQTQLPLHLEKFHEGNADTFTLSERTLDDIRNKMRVVHGVLRRPNFEGISERAAVLSWPLCKATNARALAQSLTREFQVDVRVLGDSFHVEWPPSVQMHAATRAAASKDKREELTVRRAAASEKKKKGDRLKALLRGAESSNTNVDAASANASVDRKVVNEQAQVDTLAFLAHAAVTQCVAPQRLLVLSEDPQRGLRLVGLNTSPTDDVADLLAAAADSPDAVAKLKAIAFGEQRASSKSTELHHRQQPQDNSSTLDQPGHDSHTTTSAFSSPQSFGASPAASEVVSVDDTHGRLRVVEHLLPVDVALAHRLCINTVQRRSEAAYGLHTSSPNPLLSDEFAELRGLLMESVRHDLPPWVKRKSLLGGMIAGTSFNGGLLNIAARVAQQTSISLDHLETHAQHHFCGLTDVLLAENFPNPLLVLPSAALTAAVLRAVESPRITYVPEVSVAAALLVQPSLWLASRAADVRRRLAQDSFYASHTSAQRGRTFTRPHRKENPTAAPDATWTKGGGWNPLSYQESTKGT